MRISALLGLMLFAFFFLMVAAESLGVRAADPQGSPRDPAPSAAARLGASRPGEAVHASGTIAVLALGASGLVALIGRPERSGSAYQVLGATTGILLTLPLVGDPDNFGGQAGWIDPAFLIVVVPSLIAAAAARPWRGPRLHGVPRPRFLVLAAAAALPAAWYGIDQALMQRNTFPPTADPHHNAHWWAMAVLAFMMVLVMGAAALGSTSWRMGAWGSALAAIALGTASILAPSSASALGPEWAVAAIFWGLVGIWFMFRTGKKRRSTF